jgi:protein-disulfide isomerase
MEPTQPPVYERPSPWIVPISIIIAGALIGGGIFLSSRAPVARSAQNGPLPIDVINVASVSADEHLLGSPNAPITIIEFSDSECPYCKQFHVTMKRIMNEYGANGQIAWVYRHYPVASSHPLAPKQAEGLECAAELGGNATFWELADAIYLRQGGAPLDTTELTKLAGTVGLDEDKFSDCVASGKMALRVQEDMEDGDRAGVAGTPHSILITRKGEKVMIKGAQPYDVMKSVIDAALAAQAE